MRILDLKKLISQLPDETPVLIRDSEHGVFLCSARPTTARQNPNEPEKYYTSGEYGYILYHKVSPPIIVLVLE